jgi:hypothetical protein
MGHIRVCFMLMAFNLLGGNINIIKHSNSVRCKEIGIEINAEETNYMFVSRHQTTGQNYIKVANKSFENVVKFKYLGMLTNQSCIHEEIISRSNSENAFYHAVQNILSFRLLPKNIKINMYKTIILPVVFMDVKPGLSR